MSVPLVVDLTRPPGERWRLSPKQCDQARQLLAIYSRDAGLDADEIGMVASVVRPLLPPQHRVELAALADLLDVSTDAVIVGNAYYDLIKTALACSAFTVASPDGPLHARNLDWWTENSLLSVASLETRFVGGPAGDFTSIGWPGFAGVLSGIAPGRFAITLNAVISDEPQQFTMPVGFAIRQVFEQAPDYDAAVRQLSEAVLPCDCLLLVSGTEPDEMVVIERTPTRHALRHPVEGMVHATNDYRLIDPDTSKPLSSLQETSCGRYDRLAALLRTAPASPEACLAVLNDPKVIMSITVQQMAFQATAGTMIWRAV